MSRLITLDEVRSSELLRGAVSLRPRPAVPRYVDFRPGMGKCCGRPGLRFSPLRLRDASNSSPRCPAPENTLPYQLQPRKRTVPRLPPAEKWWTDTQILLTLSRVRPGPPSGRCARRRRPSDERWKGPAVAFLVGSSAHLVYGRAGSAISSSDARVISENHATAQCGCRDLRRRSTAARVGRRASRAARTACRSREP